MRAFTLVALLICAELAYAQGPENVLVVVNENSALSKTIGEYYVRRRAIPLANLCRIRTSQSEEIDRAEFYGVIALSIARFLKAHELTEKILYIVTTAGVPLKIRGAAQETAAQESAAVDSELALLYSDLKSGPHRLPGSIPNPFFGKSNAKFTHAEFPIYLVTRLAAYDFEGAKGIIDRSLQAANRGKFVIDMQPGANAAGESWLRAAANALPKDRLVLEETGKVLYDESDVIGYAGWGSNDFERKKRFLGFHWLPGAIMTEFVSSNGRTFKRPPENWNISTWKTPELWFAGSPQTLTADYILEGATGASGHVYEPFLHMTPRPDILLPAYFSGRNLAESYYLSIRGLSWQNIVIGDPLCSLGKPSVK
jgi:uncharacterized protein (TIGR03790 family)